MLCQDRHSICYSLWIVCKSEIGLENKKEERGRYMENVCVGSWISVAVSPGILKRASVGVEMPVPSL